MKKKIFFSIVLYLLSLILLLVPVLSLVVLIYSGYASYGFSNNDRAVFGYKTYIVRSDSMEPVFEAGDIVLVKEMRDYSSLETGDIIAYISQNPDSYGETVTHEIAEVTRTKDGTLGYITRGINTGNEDEGIVTDLFIQGKYVGRLPKADYIVRFLRSPIGNIVSSMCTVISVIIVVLVSVRLYLDIKRNRLEKSKRINPSKEILS